MPVGISIHAPRVGRDVSVLTTGLSIVAISIHAPRVGRDAPTRRPFDRCGRYFNPRAPCGARLVIGHCRALAAKFQSTRPVWGATGLALCFATLSRFQSTRPVWGATLPIIRGSVSLSISIHAPRVGRDEVSELLAMTRVKISIHAPRVGRDRISLFRRCRRCYFNPRAPCGARHLVDKFFISPADISIHAPRVGRDL